MKGFKQIKILAPFLVIAGLLVYLAPRSQKWGYDYKKGSTWHYETLFAPFDIPLLKTEDQILADRKDSTHEPVPYYKFLSEKGSAAEASLQSLDLDEWSGLREALSGALGKVYAKGVLPTEASRYSDELLLYVSRDKKARLYPIVELYTQEAAKTYVLSFVRAACSNAPVDSLLPPAVLSELVRPNLSFDAQTTALMNSYNDDEVSPTAGYIRAGQLIVSEGDVITSEICLALDSFRQEFENNVGYSGNRVFLWLGIILQVLAIMTSLYLLIFFGYRKAFSRYSQLIYLLMVFAIFSSITLIVERVNSEFMLIVPFTLAALYMQSFLKPAKVIPVYIATLLPLLVFCQNGLMFFTMYLLAGLLSFFLYPKFRRGVGQFIMAICVFFMLVVVFAAFKLVGSVSYNWITAVVLLFVGSLLTVAGYPLIFIFERLFGLVSENRLQELTDSSAELLRKLEQKAPGTYQHSLQVNNLACACARVLGANENVVRAGAMYHDIGKMMNPLCFVENESLIIKEDGSSYHGNLLPIESAQDIIKHVTDGMTLAREAHLPKIVYSFIETHHGTSCVSYFYDKFLKMGGDEAMRDNFCYKGRRPHTTEQTILMVCDSVEAASRTLAEYSQESVSSLVEHIVSGKIDQGQFDESEMTIHEIEMMKETITSYILQVHHERIQYPNR